MGCLPKKKRNCPPNLKFPRAVLLMVAKMSMYFFTPISEINNHSPLRCKSIAFLIPIATI